MIDLSSEIEKIKAANLFRTLTQGEGIDFSSNDYLGLASDQEIKKKLIAYLEKSPFLGATSSRLIRGTSAAHQEVERFLAAFIQRQGTLLFNSGYSANEGILSTLASNSVIFSDQYNHASIIDGIKLSRSPCEIYAHNDADHLERLLKRYPKSATKWIVTEALFSMDGDCAPIKDILALCHRYQAHLLVDEAHSTGIYGTRGEGLLSSFDFDEERVLSIHTCGKALGSFGAFIGCSDLMKTYLINKCRHLIYTTALPTSIVWHIKLAVESIIKSPHLREQLNSNVSYAHQKLSAIANTGKSHSPIIPLILGSNKHVLEGSHYLFECGLDVKAIRYPSVPKGTERLRLSIHANHTQSEIDFLTDKIKEIC